MEFLKASRRKNVFSEVLHVVLNLALAAAVFALVTTGSIWLALLLVIVSKWRILVVRPRYWWANIQANIVDISMSLGVVVLMHLAGTVGGGHEVLAQAGVAAVYALWLIVIKPRSSSKWVLIQAAMSLGVGTWALLATAHIGTTQVLPLGLVVVAMYIVGYGAAKHVISSRDEESQPTFLAMLFGLIVAEIGWIESYWIVAYGTDGMGEFKVAQGAIVVTLVGFLAERLYVLATSGRKIRLVEVVVPSVFTALIIAVLVLIFSAGTGII